jgi:hypothetical protein
VCLIVYTCEFITFYSNRYTLIRLFAPNYLKVYFIVHIQQSIRYKFDRFSTPKNKFSNYRDFGVGDVARSLPQNSAPEPPIFNRCGMPTSTSLPINEG